jgi:hypothetical protein
VIPRISLRQALADPALLGGVLEGESWKPWRTLLIGAMGEDLTQDERPVFKKFTGRDREPGRRVEEFVGIKGRRAGGSYAGGKVVIPYLAGLCEHPSLVRGERGVLLCVAADQRQADVISTMLTPHSARAQSSPSSSRHARSESFVSTMALTSRSVPPTTAAFAGSPSSP